MAADVLFNLEFNKSLTHYLCKMPLKARHRFVEIQFISLIEFSNHYEPYTEKALPQTLKILKKIVCFIIFSIHLI